MVGNKHKGDITLKIGDRTYLLRYDWDAFGKLNTELGPNFDEKIGEAILNMNLPVMAEVLAIGLYRYHKGELTADDIVRMSPPIVSVGDAITRAISLAFHGTEEVPETEENPLVAEKILRLLRKFLPKSKGSHTATA